MTSPTRQCLPPPPLGGATVVVTRPTASAAAMKRRIRALGGVALALPGVRISASADAFAACAALQAISAEIVVFISPNAVRHAFALLPRLRFARVTQVCAIGAGTAQALQRQGLRNVLWPAARQDSEGLLALPEFAALKGRRVVLIDAPGGRDLLPAELRARGAAVERIPVYERAVARLDRRHLASVAQAGDPLIVQLSSGETLVNLRSQLPQALFVRLTSAAAVVSSARIASAARAVGWIRVHEAASAALADMIAATVDALALHRL